MSLNLDNILLRENSFDIGQRFLPTFLVLQRTQDFEIELPWNGLAPISDFLIVLLELFKQL